MDDQALRNYFKFNEADLVADRNGEFSDHQKRKLVKQYKDNTKFGLILGLPSLAIALTLLVVTIIFFKTLGSIWMRLMVKNSSGILIHPHPFTK